jgi:hypothetical protein
LITIGSTSRESLSRLYSSRVTSSAQWYVPVSTPAMRAAASGTVMNKISSKYAVRCPA